jgi:septal ring factor EnvC (AmiA/AmiB activator)
LLLQVKNRELAAVGRDRSVNEEALRRLEAELDAVRSDLRKVTQEEYHLPEALDDIQSLKVQLENTRQARDALIMEVCWLY